MWKKLNNPSSAAAEQQTSPLGIWNSVIAKDGLKKKTSDLCRLHVHMYFHDIYFKVGSCILIVKPPTHVCFSLRHNLLCASCAPK